MTRQIGCLTVAAVLGLCCMAAPAGDLIVDNVTVYGRHVVTQDVARGSVPTNGLVLWYDFDTESTATVSDLSGSGNDGTVYNVTWTGMGMIGGAFDYNGVSGASASRIEAADGASLDITGALTLSAWINPDYTSVGLIRGILSKHRSETGYLNQRSYTLQYDTTSRIIRFAISATGGIPVALISASALPPGSWYHVCGVYDPSNTMRIYINGVEDNALSSGVPAAIYSSTAPFWVGQTAEATRGSFDGKIDSCQVYNRALSTNEIQSLYQYNGTNFFAADAQFFGGISHVKALGDIGMGAYTNRP